MMGSNITGKKKKNRGIEMTYLSSFNWLSAKLLDIALISNRYSVLGMSNITYR